MGPKVLLGSRTVGQTRPGTRTQSRTSVIESLTLRQYQKLRRTVPLEKLVPKKKKKLFLDINL